MGPGQFGEKELALWAHEGGGVVGSRKVLLFAFILEGKTCSEELAGKEEPSPRVLLPGPPHDNTMYVVLFDQNT